MQEKRRQLPTFARQVGKMVGQNRIYIEDYAYGYLCDLKNRSGVLPVRAALYGYSFEKDNTRFYVIYGVSCMMDEMPDKRTEEQIRKTFFDNYELIGYVNLYRKGEMSGQKHGCYIFYENNDAMQNYLLACRAYRDSESQMPEAGDGRTAVNTEREGYLKETSKKIVLGMLVVMAAVAAATINHYDRIYEFAAMAAKALQEVR